MNVLAKRIISGLVIVPVVIAMIFLLPFTAFWIISWLLMALVAWEWLFLAGFHSIPSRLLGVVVIITLGILVGQIGGMHEQRAILWFSLWVWLLLTPLVLTFPLTQNAWSQSRLFHVVLAMFVIIPCGCALTLAAGEAWRLHLLLGLFLIWGADIGAYFAGRHWGKSKLIPQVSPGKTIAGLVGAIVTGMVLSFIFWLIQSSAWIDDAAVLMQFLVIGVITVLASVIGDLLESMLKRNAGVKDSGNLIPGHGGVFDRLDSMLAALPIFMLFNII